MEHRFNGYSFYQFCPICYGHGGSLTTHCRGVKLSDHILELISNKKVDFIDGHWKIIGINE